MSIITLPYEANDAERWDRFVSASRNGNLFHTRSFLSYHPTDRFRDASVLLCEGNQIRAVFPAAEQKVEGRCVLASHPGASYGGLVLAGDIGAVETGATLDALITWAKEKRYSAIDFLRLPPATIRREASDDQEYWLYQRGARVHRFELDGSIDLRGWTEEAILERLTSKCRNMVRQAERFGMDVDITNDFAAFWPILESTLAARHTVKPTHTLDEIQRLHALFPTRVRLLSAHVKDQMVGGIVVITLCDHALYTLYMAQDYQHQQIHPMHLLLERLIALCIEERATVLHLGVSTEQGGKVLNEGLTFFKEGFGMRPVRRESWRMELN